MPVIGIILPRTRTAAVRRRNGKWCRLDTNKYIGHFDKCLENTGHVIRYRGHTYRNVRNMGNYWTYENQQITEDHPLYNFLGSKINGNF